jgi:hypothetical protein
VGSTATLLKNKPRALADLYRRLETMIKSFGGVEVVTRDRYGLFRTTRIFADLTVMRDALRVVVHLGRKASRTVLHQDRAGRQTVSRTSR